MNDREEAVLRAALCMTRQCWEQGMLSYALLMCGLQDMLELVVHDMVLRQSADGRLCNVEDTPAVTDSAFCIPAVLSEGKRTGREEWVRAAHKNAEFLLYDAERTTDGILYHMRGTTQVWADSAAFLPYALVITGHPKEGYLQMKGILDRLYLEKSGLYAHIRDGKTGKYPDGNAWSVGNGWILTGLLRTRRALPDEMKEERKDLETRFKALLLQILKFQCHNGGFHDIIDGPESFMESESTAMIACAIYGGIIDGILEPDKALLEKAEKMREYIRQHILEDGRVTGASSSPFFDRPGTAVECQAHVMMLNRLYRDAEAKKSNERN